MRRAVCNFGDDGGERATRAGNGRMKSMFSGIIKMNHAADSRRFDSGRRRIDPGGGGSSDVGLGGCGRRSRDRSGSLGKSGAAGGSFGVCQGYGC